MEISSVKDELNKWYEDNCTNGKLAWSYLANKSGVSSSNIRKIAKNEVARPKFETSKQLLLAIYPGEVTAIYTYLKELFPKKAASWHLELTRKRNSLESNSLDITSDRNIYRIFKLAMTGMFQVSELEDMMGKSEVEQKLKALTDANLVEVDEQGLLKRTESTEYTITSSIDTLKRESVLGTELVAEKIGADNLGVADIDRQANRLDFFHVGVSDEGSIELDLELETFKKNMVVKYSDPKYAGKNVRFVNFTVGRFDSK